MTIFISGTGQQEYNSLTEETYEKYGDAIFGKKIYILENTYGVTRFYADTFFKTFDPDGKPKEQRCLRRQH